MSYFGRLAQRVGPATPRTPVTATAAPVAVDAAAVSDVGSLESFAEVTVPGTPAAITQPATASPSPGANVAPTPADVAPEGRSQSQHDFARPNQHDVARAASPPAPREWMTLEDSVSPEHAPPDSSRAAAHDVSTRIVQPPAASGSPTRQDPAVAPVVAIFESEAALPRTESRPPAKPRAAGDPAAGPIAARSRPPQFAPETDNDPAAPPHRTLPAALRGPEARDTRRQDRALPPAARAPLLQKTREHAVEVRIGAVTLQVHAAPDAPQAPARASFAPHRHYLRMW